MHAKKIFPLVLVVLGVFAVILAGCASQQSSLTGNAARGGQLYDKWWSALGVDEPATDHPLWVTQTTNTRTGANTWRCKECHGWDYKGADGAYGSGSHFTGFVGVMKMDGKDPDDILAILKGSTNPDHDFSSVLDEQALIDLALFLNQGLIDDATIVNADKTPLNGDADAGKTIFALCSTCHGIQGTAINFDNDSEPEYLGTVASGNPWEFIHKARFGQPGVVIMPAGVSMNRQTQEYIDLLTYVHALPTESLVTEGGRLYDNWWKAMGMAEPPPGDQPLWGHTNHQHPQRRRYLALQGMSRLGLQRRGRRLRLWLAPDRFPRNDECQRYVRGGIDGMARRHGESRSRFLSLF
ncbi:MAG: hypothetical protein HND47_12185 [Chloroflexi bacterium]|nr:hypothetical protein [Chloroflexota bacterium]